MDNILTYLNQWIILDQNSMQTQNFRLKFQAANIIYWRTLETHHLLKSKFIVKKYYFNYVKNKIDKSLHLACIQ